NSDIICGMDHLVPHENAAARRQTVRSVPLMSCRTPARRCSRNSSARRTARRPSRNASETLTGRPGGKARGKEVSDTTASLPAVTGEAGILGKRFPDGSGSVKVKVPRVPKGLGQDASPNPDTYGSIALAKHSGKAMGAELRGGVGRNTIVDRH